MVICLNIEREKNIEKKNILNMKHISSPEQGSEFSKSLCSGFKFFFYFILSLNLGSDLDLKYSSIIVELWLEKYIKACPTVL